MLSAPTISVPRNCDGGLGVPCADCGLGPAEWAGWNAGHRPPVRDVGNHRRGRSDGHVGANCDALPDRRADANPRPAANTDSARQMGAWAHVDGVIEFAVVVECRSVVDDGCKTGTRKRRDDRSGENNGAGTNIRVPANDCLRMNQGRRKEAHVERTAKQPIAHGTIADRDNEFGPHEPFHALGSGRSRYWPEWVWPLDRESIVEKDKFCISSALGQVANNARVAGRADDKEGSIGHRGNLAVSRTRPTSGQRRGAWHEFLRDGARGRREVRGVLSETPRPEPS